MSLVVHHLDDSRSQRILWLLEELNVPYEIKYYKRDPITRLAPVELKQIHPLGKSPVLQDKEKIIAESGCIVEYLIRTYGKNTKFMPKEDDPMYFNYLHWLHFSEGSAMTPILLALYMSRLGDAAAPLLPRISSELTNHFTYMSDSLGDKKYFLGDEVTGADVMLVFVVEAGLNRGLLENYTNLMYIN